MGASRALGGLLCAACVAVAILHLWYGYGFSDFSAGWPHPAISLAFALPITVGVLAICGLGLWLGWIMATTKPAAPITPPPIAEEPVEKPAAKKAPRKRTRRPRKAK